MQRSICCHGQHYSSHSLSVHACFCSAMTKTCLPLYWLLEKDTHTHTVSLSPLFLSLCFSPLPSLGTEACFRPGLGEEQTGIGLWKNSIVRSHSSQMRAGAKSVAVGITPWIIPIVMPTPRWEHGKELGTASLISPPTWTQGSQVSAATRRRSRDHQREEFLRCHMLLLKGVLQPSRVCFSIHARLPVCALPPLAVTQRSLWWVLEFRQY